MLSISRHTTFQDCERDLICKGGQARLEEWRASDEVKLFTRQFEHSALYQLTLSQVLETKRQIDGSRYLAEKPLGDVSPREAIRKVDDHFPNFPLAHMFHMYVERHEHIPTYTEFKDFFIHSDYRGKCYDDFVGLIRNTLQPYDNYSDEQCSRALRWRIGNAYCSSFREVYTLVWLREKAGLNVQYHLFADTQLQTDLWLNESIICLRVPSNYLDRKRRPEDWAHQFHIIFLNIAHQGFGKLWVPTDTQLCGLAELLLHPVPRMSTEIHEDGRITQTVRFR